MLLTKRVFKTKSFDRWSRGVIADAALVRAAREIEAGQFEADLGQGVCKKRVAIPGHGKRGAARVLVAKRHREALIFLFGREKHDPGPDFPDALLSAAKTLASALQRQSIDTLDSLAAAGELKEIRGACEEDR